MNRATEGATMTDPAATQAPAADPFAGMSTRAMRAELRRRAAASKSRDVRANPVTGETGRAGNVHGRWVETSEYIAAAVRFTRGAARRAETGDLDTTDLARLATLADESDKALREAARQLHAKGYSWTEIGLAVGYDKAAARQCAFRRFSRTSRTQK
jgi:hypothetical protein